MINLPILPILIPLASAVIMIIAGKWIRFHRWFSFLSGLGTIISSLILIQKVHLHGIQTIELGGWKAPFGIVLVSDMFSALLVTTSSIILFCIVIYSYKTIGHEREKYYYYPFLQFLLVGVNGAFTTGDIFNLFVFFEVMLMSSYVLMVLGGTKIQLRESIKYILVNVISSGLFVVTVAFLYSVVGTLNMADISRKITLVNQPGILTVIAVLFLIVFGLKAALFPLFIWMPGSYYSTPTPVLALFGALLTKVGIYAITRTYTLFFYHDQAYTHELLGFLALLSIVAGMIGAIAYQDMKKIVIYNIIIAVGIILFGVSTMTADSLSGSIFYLIHDMLIKASLFLLVGIIIQITGSSKLSNVQGLIKEYPLLAWIFFIGALSLAGVPPFSGFVGKLLIVRSGFESGQYIGGGIVLFSSLVVLYSIMKIFIKGFWGEPKSYTNMDKASVTKMLIPAGILIVFSIFYGVGSETIYPYIHQASDVLMNPDLYIKAVLKEQ